MRLLAVCGREAAYYGSFNVMPPPHTAKANRRVPINTDNMHS